MRMTIEELAGMVQRGFADIQSRFVTIDMFEKRMDALEKKMEQRFNDVQAQLDNIYTNYTTMREHELLRDRVKHIERRVGIRTAV